MKIRIIGLGSPHGDDQAGWEVVRLLQQHHFDSAELIALDRPGAALLSYLKSCDRVILIDACDAGWPAGRWQDYSLVQLLESAVADSGSSHQLGLAGTLELAWVLAEPLPELSCYVIQAACFDPLSPLSAEVASACQEVAGQLQMLVQAPVQELA